MAHSSRSKSKLRAKNAKVTGKNSDYLKINDDRRTRLAQKLKENLIKQKLEKGETIEETVESESKMETDEVAAKVSTAGWRASRHNQYKKHNASKKSKKNKTMKF